MTQERLLVCVSDETQTGIVVHVLDEARGAVGYAHQNQQ